jgi:hypothetical protein
MTRRAIPRSTLDRLFPPDVIPLVEILIVPAQPDLPLGPVVDVVLVPKKAGDQ